MVCSRVSRIISVIRRDHQKIIFPEVFKEFAKLRIKALQLFPISHRISPVSPQGIEIHEIHKAESLKILILADLDGLFHSVDGALGAECLRDALSVEDITDLSDGNHIVPVVL